MKIKKIGIIGQGKFGTLLKEILPSVFPSAEIISCGREAISDVRNCDLVIPAVPTESFAEVIGIISPLLKRHSIVMDVCSVKSYPVSVMKKELPVDISIIATHPMFGPGTMAKLRCSIQGLRIVMENITASSEEYLVIKQALQTAGFEIIEMSAEDHDRHAAEFHFTAHIIAALVKKIRLTRSSIDTKSVESLFDFVEMVQSDEQLLMEMYTYNPFCKKQLRKMNTAYQSISTLLQQS